MGKYLKTAIALLPFMSAPAFAQTSGPQLLVACVEQTSGVVVASLSPCVDDSAGNHYAPTEVQGYILSANDYGALQAGEAPIDYGTVSGYFAGAFVSVLGCWLLGQAVGLVMNTVRST